MYLLCQIVVNTFADKYLHPDVSYKKKYHVYDTH